MKIEVRIEEANLAGALNAEGFLERRCETGTLFNPLSLVEPRGFEPLTSAVRLRRSPN